MIIDPQDAEAAKAEQIDRLREQMRKQQKQLELAAGSISMLMDEISRLEKGENDEQVDF